MGGAFDGAAGIVAALEAARVINNEKIKKIRDLLKLLQWWKKKALDLKKE